MSNFPVTWIVVADAGRSRMLSWTSAKGDLIELEDSVNPEARLPDAALTSDRSGSGTDAAGHGRHSMGHEHSAKQQQSEAFARTVAQRLLAGLNEHEYERLVLIAPPEFLGLLRATLDDQVCQCVAEVIGLDLTKASAREIRKRLPPPAALA